MVLTDDDVVRGLSAAEAVAAARSALIAAYRGAAVAPPRVRAELTDDLALVMTAGGMRDGPVGARIYGTWPGVSDQVVAVWDGGGRMQAIVVGAQLGDRRTGALGGVAVDLLAPRDAATVAVLGSGRQAWTQLWAVAAVRRVRGVRVFSPNPAHATAFTQRARAELNLDAATAGTARAAVDGAQVIVVATNSRTPVIDAAALRPGMHINTIGPKFRGAHELPAEWADRATVVATDSPSQAAAYGQPFFTGRDLVHLGAILDGDAPGRRSPQDITLYCSTGLAGSEIAVATALVRGLRRDD